GTGSQNGNLNRWGDYSQLSVDPVDDCTFWYTTEYIATTGSFNWRTRIGSFKFATCPAGGASPTPSPTASPATPTPTATPTPGITPSPTPAATATPSPFTFPDLVLTMTDSPDPVRVGNNLTYTITVSNVDP